MAKLKSTLQPHTHSTPRTRSARHTTQQHSPPKEDTVPLPRMEDLVDAFSQGHPQVEPAKPTESKPNSLLVQSSLLKRVSDSPAQAPADLQSMRDYMSIFEDYINDSQYWPTSPRKVRKYQLIEDIAILYFVASANSHDKINLVFWDYLVSANIFQRNATSLRDRYLSYLSYLTNLDISRIGTYVEKNSVHAFLDFTTHPDGTRSLQAILPAGASRQYGRPLFSSSFEVSSLADLRMTARLCHKFNVSPGAVFSNTYLQTLSEKIKDTPVKKVKLVVNDEPELQVEYFLRKFGMGRQEVLDKLQQVSGDWKDLLEVVRRPEQEKAWVWSAKEDAQLRRKRGVSGKSEAAVTKRKAFLGLP